VAKYDHIDFSPPSGVRSEAAKGLAWRSEYGRGGTAVGVARARDLSNGTNISPDTAKRMASYFARHEVDKQGEGWSPGEDGWPSAGRIAWSLWGGDPGQAWASKLTKQIEAADENARSMTMNIERRSLAIDEVESAVPLLAVESRSAEDGSEQEYIVGYAAKFGVTSLELDGSFIERRRKGGPAVLRQVPPATGTHGRKAHEDHRPRQRNQRVSEAAWPLDRAIPAHAAAKAGSSLRRASGRASTRLAISGASGAAAPTSTSSRRPRFAA
jgi:hypothetical protein